MSAQILNGQDIADRLQAQIAHEVEAFKGRYGIVPGLGVVMAGDNPASAQYVRMKRKACEKVGIHSVTHLVNSSTPQDEVLSLVRALNDDPLIHGVLVQLPLPAHIDEVAVLSAVGLEKDVDGFHPLNIGALAMKGREPSFVPATPSGCMVLLREAGVELDGANAVILGRSNIVGLPMTLLLMKANATVTVCHSRTRGLADVVRRADVLIAAVGRAEMVRGDWIKHGAVVIDVGTNKVDDPSSDKGYKIVGDVHFPSAVEVASVITKVPGGVGPMTITMLLSNTLKAARQHVGEKV
ncbi:MAG: bifunctional 5,10-methylenetetrahydrofolate dehydrogenase/5,10-methenyltetrahydrofolate cyclohydrolase [Anaerolineae bacterium]|nr:bifunctional 5,10-methylenetetrahydrofolate dehydrogenase/5,10-methenyltetrahydrofolate cyclohydrolase [Anaerolineae bacterium]MDW8171444.1 bifunctional 5,10-methylenetetrahydrofolate dehydrogenase/5,10-methenyltetrahydrofolate cyclohydrolase [Anaerolineae bacterium]